jgi:aminoglycoside phosphotransferase (APT) family kinase protein
MVTTNLRRVSAAEWIDAFAQRARAAEAHEGKPVLAHADWRVEHLRFQDGRIVATYDWDSLAFRPETELVGISAHGFTADLDFGRISPYSDGG